jgi:hypothetical protein
MSFVGCSLSLPARVRRARSGARVSLAVRHPGAGVTFQAYPLLTAWSWDPFVLGILALSGALYALGWYRLGHRSRSRGHALAAPRGFTWHARATPAPDPYDALADVLEATLRLDGLQASSLASPLAT